jgi:hypothetical protein
MLNETYYYTIKENNKDWDQCPQISIVCSDWSIFVENCLNESKRHKTEVRGSLYKGYNSQGYYFLHKENQ